MLLANRYEIVKKLSEGGFGVTYLARDIQRPSHPECVVKELHSFHYNKPDVLRLFQQEAQVLESLGEHDQIPRLLASFQENNRFYLVQEYIEGVTLRDELNPKNLPKQSKPEAYVLEFLRDTLTVLKFVHQQGVVHRDIKPENLMRRQRDGKIMLIDFGAVKELTQSQIKAPGRITATVSIGTAGYSPFEQMQQGNPRPASDLYALGMTAIEALTGKAPSSLLLDPDTNKVIWRNSVKVSKYLGALLDQMVHPHYQRRFRDAGVVLQALAQIPGISASKTPSPQPISEPVQPRSKIAPPSLTVPPPPIPRKQSPKAKPPQPQASLSVSKASELRQPAGKGVVSSLQKRTKLNQQPQVAPVMSPTVAVRPVSSKPAPKKKAAQQKMSSQLPRRHVLKYLGFGSVGALGLTGLAKVFSDGRSRGVIATGNIQLEDFQFETVQLSDTGKVTKRDLLIRKLFNQQISGDVSLPMVQIPAGTFLMGSPDSEEGRFDREGPQHEVTVPGFFMAQTPVTQAQWKAVAKLPTVKVGMEEAPLNLKGDRRPVERISWWEAQEFCDRLSNLTGLTYRLPSEAEWEYACRAGTTTPFYFGETIMTEVANYRGQDWEFLGKVYLGNYGRGPKGKFLEQATDVAKFPANPWGLYDMHGNVLEWCADHWHDSYQGAPTNGSAWLTDKKDAARLLRGGSCYSFPANCRSAYRSFSSPGHRDSGLGFRVCVFVAA